MEAIISYFSQQGVLGIVIIMLVSVIVWQQKRIDLKDKQIYDLQEKRKTDTDAYTASYTLVAKEQIGTQRDSVNSLNLLQRSIDSIANALQNIIKK